MNLLFRLIMNFAESQINTFQIFKYLSNQMNGSHNSAQSDTVPDQLKINFVEGGQKKTINSATNRLESEETKVRDYHHNILSFTH